MQFHEVAEIFPMMTPDERQELIADIRQNGLREPIWTYDDKIIDGRNRYLACEEAGTEPTYREWDGQGSLVAFVVSLNLKRRHLTSSQRAMIAADILPKLEAEARARQGKRTDLQAATDLVEIFPPSDAVTVSGKSREIAADLTDTNARYVSDAKRIMQEDPDLAERVRDGELSIPAAKAMLPKPPTLDPESFAQTTIDDFLPQMEPQPTVEELKARLEQAESLLVKTENTLDFYARMEGFGDEADTRYYATKEEIGQFFGETEPDDDPDEDDGETDAPIPFASLPVLNAEVVAPMRPLPSTNILTNVNAMIANNLARQPETIAHPFAEYLDVLSGHLNITDFVLNAWFSTSDEDEWDMVERTFSSVERFFARVRNKQMQRQQPFEVAAK